MRILDRFLKVMAVLSLMLLSAAPGEARGRKAEKLYSEGKKAEIRKVRFHDLRHFFASMLIAQGESPKYVSDQLGHSSVQITFDIYGHLLPQAKAEASEKFEGRMLKARGQASVSKLLASDEEGDSEDGKPRRVN